VKGLSARAWLQLRAGSLAVARRKGYTAGRQMTSDYEQRRQREAAFHDDWAASIDTETMLVDETFTAATAAENKYVLEEFGPLTGKRVLDYGCGAAEAGVYFAKLGASVVGVDVSPGMLAAAQKLAARHGVAIETRLVTADGIPAENEEFDLIYGNGVLHHVDMAKARPELRRILKPHGQGCFIEPLEYNPVIGVYRRIADTVRTADEHPLSFRDIEAFKEYFVDVKHREFWLTALAVFLRFYLIERADPKKERYWKKIYTDAERLASFYGSLRRIDDVILKYVPALGRMCWNTVISVGRPRAENETPSR
jgi:SAM-dependent methyltransferase